MLSIYLPELAWLIVAVIEGAKTGQNILGLLQDILPQNGSSRSAAASSLAHLRGWLHLYR